MGYRENKKRAITYNTEPTLTDQSGAHDADINVIVGRFLKTGVAPGSAQEPMYGDFTELPEDLRGYLETARSLKDLKGKLPPQLQGKSMEELMALKIEDIAAILTPPDKPADSESNKT